MNGTANPNYFIDRMGNAFNAEGHEMSQFDTRGYKRVKLSRGCKRGMYSVHRLVAQTYIPNPENYPVINHLDTIRSNNIVENLEWCTHQRNNQYTVEFHGKPTHSNKKVFQIDLLTGEKLREFESMTTAMEETGIQKANISKVCRGERDKAGGYFWEYAS